MTIIILLFETTLRTYREDGINLVKYLGQSGCFRLTDVLTVSVRFDSRGAARPVQQPVTVGQQEGILYTAGALHHQLGY